MEDYLANVVGVSSLHFFIKKKEFSTIVTKKALPRIIDWYLDDIRNCYLLNLNLSVIGLCRVLLEVACRRIYDGLPGYQKDKRIDMDREIHVKTVIARVCNVKNVGKEKEARAIELYEESSDILHGKMDKYPSDDDAIGFVKEVFSIIEGLYSDDV